LEQLLILAQVATQLVLPAPEDFILNAQFVTLLLLLYSQAQQNAEECAQQDNSGNPQIILVSPACPLVLTALGLELMIATLALMGFI
jgi:hypothetical protein